MSRGRARALKVELEPGLSLGTSEKVEPETWRASKFYSIKAPIFWALLKKSSLSLDQAWALLQMLSSSPPKKGSDPSLLSNLVLVIIHKIGNPKQNSIEANVSIEVKTKHSFCCLYQKEYRQHSSEKRVLCLMKCSSKTLENLPYFWNMKTRIVYFSLFILC